MEPKEKTKVGKFIQKASPILGKWLIRPAVKTLLPFIGTPIVELATNIIGVKKIDKLTGAQVPKHDYSSILVSSIIGFSLLIALYTKTITIYQLIDLANQFLPMP